MLNILMSRPYIGNDLFELFLENKDTMRLLIDSGAFTNWKKGKESSVDEYMTFLSDLPVQPWNYFTLDKIGDSEVTRQNHQKMIGQGFKPIPIFTRGTDLDELDELYDTSDLVGVGVGVGSNNYKGYLQHVIENNDDRPLHWLGVTNPQMVGMFKPFSCDSSSWESGGRYGSINIYLGRGSFKTYKRLDAIKKAPEPKVWKSIRTYGFNPKDLQFEENWHGGHSIARTLGCQSWVRYLIDVKQRFNTELFMACTTKYGVKLCIDAYKKEMELAVI